MRLRPGWSLLLICQWGAGGPRSDPVVAWLWWENNSIQHCAEKMRLEFADLEISGEQRLDLAILTRLHLSTTEPNNVHIKNAHGYHPRG